MNNTNHCLHEGDILKVSRTSRTTALAGAIAAMIRGYGHVEIQAVGASAVNQAIKAIATAQVYLTRDSIVITMMPSYKDIEIEGSERTAIYMEVITQ